MNEQPPNSIQDEQYPILNREQQVQAIHMLQDCVLWLEQLRRTVPKKDRASHKVIEQALYSTPDHTEEWYAILTGRKAT